jgi:hypothetical protein
MSQRSYRLTVLASALFWFMLGLHAPIVHQFTHHDRVPSLSMLAIVGALAAAGVATVLALLRAPAVTASGVRD